MNKILGCVLIAFAVYPTFFGLIAFAVYWTESMLPLWFLLLTPSMTNCGNEENKE